MHGILAYEQERIWRSKQSGITRNKISYIMKLDSRDSFRLTWSLSREIADRKKKQIFHFVIQKEFSICKKKSQIRFWGVLYILLIYILVRLIKIYILFSLRTIENIYKHSVCSIFEYYIFPNQSYFLIFHHSNNFVFV